jgi:hypothetical protein
VINRNISSAAACMPSLVKDADATTSDSVGVRSSGWTDWDSLRTCEQGGPYRDVLAIADARTLTGASAASQLGDWLYNAALLGYVYSATGSAAWVGAAAIGRLLPDVLLGAAGGAIADRYPGHTVLLVGDGLCFLLMVALAAAVAADGPGPW